MSQRLKCIQKQFAQLRLNPNIIKLQLQESSQYVLLTYAPPETNAYFQNSSYHLRIDLPFDYPEQPPTVYFQDIIYHLNIHQTTGEVFMSIIKEDWSPYLTLNSVIQTISSILIEADVQYPASKAMLKQYNDQYGLYLEKMHNSVRTVQKFNEKINKEILYIGLTKVGAVPLQTKQDKNILTIQNDKFFNIRKRRKSQNFMELLQIPKVGYEPEQSEISKLDILLRQDDFNRKINRNRSKYTIKSDAGSDDNYFQMNLENQVSEDNYQSIPRIHPAKKYEQTLKITRHLSNWKNNQLRKSNRSIIPSFPTKQRQQINKSRVISKPSINTSSTKCQIAIEQQKLESIYNTIQLFISHCQKLQKQALSIQNPRLKQLIQNEIQEQTTIIEQLNKVASKTRRIFVKKLTISQKQ